MLGEERQPEDQWRRIGMSASLKESRSEEMTQSKASSLQGLEVPFEFQRE